MMSEGAMRWWATIRAKDHRKRAERTKRRSAELRRELIKGIKLLLPRPFTRGLARLIPSQTQPSPQAPLIPSVPIPLIILRFSLRRSIHVHSDRLLRSCPGRTSGSGSRRRWEVSHERRQREDLLATPGRTGARGGMHAARSSIPRRGRRRGSEVRLGRRRRGDMMEVRLEGGGEGDGR